MALLLPVNALVRFLLGGLFALFLPGYATVASLFPTADPPRRAAPRAEADEDLARPPSTSERLVLSLGLSLAIVAFLGFLVQLGPWGVQFAPIAATVGAYTAVATAVAFLRRVRTPAAQRYQPRLAAESWKKASPAERRVLAGLAAALLILVGAVAVVQGWRSPAEGLTEFYLETPEGDGFQAWHRVRAGENQSAVVVIVNRERGLIDYELRIFGIRAALPEERALLGFSKFPVAPGNAYDYPVNYPVPHDAYRVEFELYRAAVTAPEPYRFLVLAYPGE